MSIKKVILAVLVIMTVFFYGCKSPETTDINTPIPSISVSPFVDEVLQITVYHKVKRIQNPEWLSFIKDTYGLDITNAVQTEKNDVPFLENVLNEQNLSGLVYLTSKEYFDIYDRIEKYALPLDEYLKDNGIWNVLPEEMKYSANIKGITWGIPFSFYAVDLYQPLRSYNGGIIDKLGIDIPSTLNEFYDMCVKVRDLDQNRDILNSNIDTMFFEYYDVFAAFGVPVKPVPIDMQTIMYDSEKNIVRDFAYDKGVRDSLYFIKSLYDAGFIKITENNYDSILNFFSDKTVSAITGFYDRIKFKKKKIYNSAIFHGENKNIKMPISKIIGYYILMKDTPEPKKIINRLVNSFFKDEKSNMHVYLGQNESDYEIRENIIVYKTNLYKEAPLLFKDLVSDKLVINGLSKTGKVKDIPEKDKEFWEKQVALYLEETKNIKFMPYLPIDEALLSFKDDIIMGFQNHFRHIFDDNITIDEIYDAYELDMKKRGIYEYIENLNGKLH